MKFKNEQVKIGTCEDCYYITFQQMTNLKNELQDIGDGSPFEYLKIDSGFRFRFPFPDEIGKPPFNQKDYNRGFLLSIPKYLPVEIGHKDKFIRIGFENNNTHDKEVGINIPCPQSEEFTGYKWNNANWLHLEITMQKYVTHAGKRELQTVVRCPYCGASSRIDKSEAEAIMGYYRGLSEKNPDFYAGHIHILESVLAGYSLD